MNAPDIGPCIACRTAGRLLRTSSSGQNSATPVPVKAQYAAALRAFKKNLLRSVNFMRSGWIPAIKVLKLLVHESSERMEGMGGKEGWGGSVPAHNVGKAIEGEIFNQSIAKMSPTSSQALDQYGTPALNAAIVEKTKDMEIYITRKHDERASKFNR